MAEILADFPDLQPAYIQPVLRYAAERSHDSPAHAAQIVMASELKPLLEGRHHPS